MSDAKTLLDLSRVDLSLMRIKKQHDELPQRAQLLELKAQQVSVETKDAQVKQLRKECDQALSQFADEEVMVKQKMAEAQSQVDKTSNYKEVAAHTKEIEGFAKRLEKLEFDSLKYMEKADKINEVGAQVSAALVRLDKQYQELHSNFQAQAAALKKEELTEQQERERLFAALPHELAQRYEKARAAKGGFGAAHIEGTHCSGCRVAFTEGQLAKFANAEQISECPYCHRLLVTD